jgi:hypothetical protein
MIPTVPVRLDSALGVAGIATGVVHGSGPGGLTLNERFLPMAVDLIRYESPRRAVGYETIRPARFGSVPMIRQRCRTVREPWASR